MTLKIFLLRIQFTMDRPNNIHPYRWGGMLRWFDTRNARNDGLDFTTQEREEILEEIAFARERDRLKYRFWDDNYDEYAATSYPLS